MRHTASTPSTNQSVLPSSMRSYFTHTDKNGGLEEFEHHGKTVHHSSGPLALDATGLP